MNLSIVFCLADIDDAIDSPVASAFRRLLVPDLILRIAQTLCKIKKINRLKSEQPPKVALVPRIR